MTITSATITSATDTHCPYCALQCGMRLTPAGRTVEVAPREFPTNRGGLCRKGWTAAEVLTVGDRVTRPLVRDADGDLVAATWERALAVVADGLRDVRRRHGADAVGVFGGGGLTNEKAYHLGKFARVALGTSRIDYNGRFCMSSAAAAANRALGVDRGLPFPVTDLDAASTILLLGSNPAATMPPLLSHLQGARERGGLVVVDPRRSQTAELTAEGGGTHLAPAPGTDLVLLLGLTHVVLAEGLADEAYLGERTEGLRELRLSVNAWWPERVQQVTGVPVGRIRDVARRLAAGNGVYVITGRGVEQHVDGTDTATAAINLALVLGLVGRPGSGYGTLTGQGNGQGGREHGQKCDQLPGYRSISDPAARKHMAGVWGVAADELPGPGLPAVELLASMGRPGGVRALLVHGSNVVVSAPDAGAVRAGLGGLDLLVVCDFVLSETAELADVVLPVTQWAEEEGTTTSLEGRVLRRRAAVPPPGEARSDLWVLAELARLLDAPGAWPTEPAQVFDELARASAGGPADYSGLSHRLLDTGVAAYWPCPAHVIPEPGSRVTVEGDVVGTPRLFADRFPRPGGRARLVPVTPVVREPLGQRGGQLTMITGRLLEHYQSGAQTRRVPELLAAQPRLTAELHPATASRLRLVEGDEVSVRSPRGSVRARLRLSPGMRLDTVFLPFHYAGAECTNLLTEAAVDPVSRMPEFKRTLVVVGPPDDEADQEDLP
ncbi:molybdopterin oxidoreductase family protein [Ornithinimicrobium cerasi]|uniref:molybdopterin oxidoreductase family protein n=1 Tax=Ornithinimicrobium cerasi TaxID=2248773 RepID=UPI001F21B47B|nr:molybdopterin oxidoreductase family protein [Ornithinimicrobium cerasi]